MTKPITSDPQIVMTANSVQVDIANAPSKWELSVKFFDGGGGQRRPVEFTVNGKFFNGEDRLVEVVINRLSWEDGSGESWCFEGYIVGMNLNVTGWFRTTNRKGWMKFTK